MDWITDNIAIGDFKDAEAHFDDFDAILCLTQDKCCKDREDVDTFCVPFIDGVGNSQASIEEAIDTIASLVSSNSRILVHCHAGRSRSVCIVAAYFMRHRGMTQDDALDFVRGKRESYLSDGVEEILRMANREPIPANKG